MSGEWWEGVAPNVGLRARRGLTVVDYWERTWIERSEEVERVFGPTEPPGIVTSFSWTDKIRSPGACALTFPPIEAQRDPIRQARSGWLFLTLGLSQPPDEKWVRAAREAGNPWSGYGFEMAMITPEREDWVFSALRLWMQQATDGEPTGVGHRFPFGLCRNAEGALVPFIGYAETFRVEPIGTIRAALHWPLRHRDHVIRTSTGKFEVLVAIGITADEWQFAKETSSAHLQLLLCKAGVNQQTLINRPSVLRDDLLRTERQRLVSLSPEQCWQELQTAG